MIKFKAFPLGGINGLFEIKTTKKKFNANTVEFGGIYPYVIRSSMNNGIRGYITEDVKYLNEANTISFGQDTATMFYQKSPYFTGDKIKIFSYKSRKLDRKLAMYLITCMRKAFSTFSWGNSFFDVKILNNIMIFLPVNDSGEIDYDYIEEHVSELEKELIGKFETYLQDSGLDNCELTEEDNTILSYKLKWGKFKIVDLFDVKNTHCIMSRDIVKNSGIIPYLTASRENNAVGSYISFDENLIDEGNSIFIGGKTFVVTYQKNNYFSNDSHNLSLCLKNNNYRTEAVQLFLVTSIYNGLKNKYSWGDSISYKKIQKDIIMLPMTDEKTPDFDYMEAYIKAQQKLVIKDVILWKDGIINAE